MAFFDFLAHHPKYCNDQNSRDRLNCRYEFLIEPYLEELEGARILDLASNDGRWSYALSSAGARFVHGIEGRQHLIDEFQMYPKDEAHSRVTLEQNDIFDALRRMIKRRRRFDVIAAFGIFYHITEHYELLTLIKALRPKLILIDSQFMLNNSPIVQFAREDSTKNLNSIRRTPGQTTTFIGTPSRRWVDIAAQTLEYDTHWANWGSLAPERRESVDDYFNGKFKRRGTVALCPQSPDIE